MLCKIYDDPQKAKPVAWRSAATSPESSRHTASALPRPSDSGDVAELRQKLAESERITQSQLAQIRQTAFQEGLQQGRDQCAESVKCSSDQLAKMLADLTFLKRRVRNEAEMDVLKLSLAVARRILHRELVSDPEAIQGLVHAALQKLQNREITRVRIGAGTVEALRNCLERAGVAQAIQVVSDPTLQPGDLVFETSSGELDASIDTQLQEIQRGFADRLALKS